MSAPSNVSCIIKSYANNHCSIQGFFETTIKELLWRAESNSASTMSREDRAFRIVHVDGDGKDFGTVSVVAASIEASNQESTTNSSKGGSSYKSSSSIMADLKSKSDLRLALKGVELANVEGWFGCSDPFFTVEALADSSWQTYYKSEHINDNLDPVWETATLSLDELLDGDEKRPLRVSVFDWEESNNHQTMGFFETSLKDLLRRGELNRSNPTESGVEPFTLRDNDGRDYGKVVVVDALIM